MIVSKCLKMSQNIYIFFAIKSTNRINNLINMLLFHFFTVFHLQINKTINTDKTRQNNLNYFVKKPLN